MDYLYIILLSIFSLLIFITLLFFHLKKKRVIRKVQSLTLTEKGKLLDSLGKPIGYQYDAHQDLFIARQDAPHKIFGYTTLYDLSAPYFNMIFDYETIYFDYDEKTWLIEMWKGQYGINTGCELGIYYADSIIPPEKYSSTFFHSAHKKDMLDISLNLNQISANRQKAFDVGRIRARHWWLTLFKIGMFTKPQNLLVNTAIRFKDCHMMYSFLNSFEKTLPYVSYNVNGLTVYFTYYHSNRQYPFFKKIVRSIALAACHLYCILFQFLTKPFENSGDKILYLYYYLPFTVRLIFKQKSKK